jgi:hypothetical protein
MKIRAIDADGDWRYGLGRQDYKTDEKALDQNIITKIKSWRNDCFFDVDAGIDWYNLLGGKDIRSLENNVIQTILAVDGVNSIESFETYLDSKTRQLRMNVVINTIYGGSVLNENL